MPTVEHSALTAANLHEPKGADTATVGQVYIADGLGSGTWTTWPLGWGYYKDDGSAQNFTSTPSLITIDAAGATTEESYLPRAIRGSTSLWNSTTNRIIPISEGDAYEIRLDLPVTAETASPTELTLEFDIAGSTYASRTTIVNRYIGTGKATPYTISVGFPIFVGSTFIANGCQIWAYTDTGNLDITKPGITIVRQHAGTM